LKGPADLVAEIVNEEGEERDRVEKLAEFAAAGVREYWLVDSREDRPGIDAFAPSPAGRYEPILPDSQGRLHSAVAPGFWFDPTWLNEEPLPFFWDVAFWIAPEAMQRHIDGIIKESRRLD
jgi:Uma2 family endonuclease